jgi:Cof subfamily protein (haloacid dehalogenase superfamily)
VTNSTVHPDLGHTSPRPAAHRHANAPATPSGARTRTNPLLGGRHAVAGRVPRDHAGAIQAGAALADGRIGLPKLVATDLDGTVVRSDNTVSGRTFAAFARIKAAGVPIVGVTGRGPRLLELSRRDLPVADYLVLAQGGHVVDLTTGPNPVTLFTDAMPSAVVAEVVATIEEAAGPLSILIEPSGATDTFLWGEHHPSWRFADAVRPCTRVEAFSAPAIKAFAHSDTYNADELLAIARSVVGPEIVEMTQAGLGYIEICPRGVTKATGLQVVASQLGVDAADVLIFGDMPNDLPAFGWAGWSRVAVANAHPELLALADEVTLSNDDDGVAIYLERLLSDA